MKKIRYLLLIIIMLLLVGCDSKETTINEIYNKVYDVTISITEFQDLVVAVGEKCDAGTIGVLNKTRNGFMNIDQSSGSGFVYDGYAVILNEKTGLYEKVELDVLVENNFEGYNITGFVYYAITNHHVIDDAISLTAYYKDGLESKAEILTFNKKLDLAIIKFETTIYLPLLELGDSDNVKKGQFAIAIGSPEGFDYFNSLTFGIVSHPNRLVKDDYGENLFIQTDTAINPGNSGGPLLNIYGEVIGVNTMKLVSEDIDSMGFSIPINIVKEFIKDSNIK